MIFVGIDNGVTGSIGVIKDNEYFLYKTPVRKCIDFNKKREKQVSRLDVNKFRELLNFNTFDVIIALERPLINPRNFYATLTAVRCFEAMLIVIEEYNYKYVVIDSKLWQRKYLGKDVRGADLKVVSKEKGLILFGDKGNFKDYDGLFIAYYLMENYDRYK